jgi:hypothetical protein
LIRINAAPWFRAMLEQTIEESRMSIHSWARIALEAELQGAEAQGFDRLLALRALLAEVVEQNRGLRDAQELAHELQFLADNLDDERDYAFMRP